MGVIDRLNWPKMIAQGMATIPLLFAIFAPLRLVPGEISLYHSTAIALIAFISGLWVASIDNRWDTGSEQE